MKHYVTAIKNRSFFCNKTCFLCRETLLCIFLTILKIIRQKQRKKIVSRNVQTSAQSFFTYPTQKVVTE